MFFQLDLLYWAMMIPAMLLAFGAFLKVRSTFAEYSGVPTQRGLTGAEAARRVLRDAGIDDVEVKEVDGFLSDHYDPSQRTLNLSSKVFRSSSVAAVGVAAHEAGHAVQHAHGYVAMALRSFMVPAAGIGSMLSFPLIMIGAFMHAFLLVKIGIVFFTAVVIFQLVTLPVEFNASSRAKAALRTSGIVSTEEEARGVRKVLSAAALTYVAALVTSLTQLLYFLMAFGGGSRDE